MRRRRLRWCYLDAGGVRGGGRLATSQQALVVRIMKTRKMLVHALLVEAVLRESRDRFVPTMAAIKKCVEGMSRVVVRHRRCATVCWLQLPAWLKRQCSRQSARPVANQSRSGARIQT